jgi:hypothetical protein
MHAIIAGCNKAGTTSLFRYLADHPQISPSRKKETDFFLNDMGPDFESARASYDALFVPRDRAFLRLEASPAYLRRGRLVAERIARTLPDARLIFILREPASRIVSYLRINAQNMYKAEVAMLDDETYVELVERVATGESVPAEPGPMRNALLQFQGGCYARYLLEFFEYFDTGRVQILFFDDLSADEREFTRRVCRILGVDPAFYDGYSFQIENRTADHRFGKLHQSMTRLNMRLEPLLNRLPGVRRALRSCYRLVNERRGATRGNRRFDEGLVRRLEAVYRPHNQALETLLQERYPQLALPDWVRGVCPS